MYESFYGLYEKPFNLTPDPRFLYLSEKHKEAFAHLLYGIRNKSGFVMVSGEIGTGKTTICRSLLKQLDAGIDVAFVFNPYLSPEELLRRINEDFGISSTADSIVGLIDELNAYLLEQSAKGKNCVLIIDEAQNLSTEVLEQVRLLSNLETETEKLLQIVLIGQPELAEKLDLTEMRQLNQRITARYHLEALNASETLHYIAFRLRVAGGRRKVTFTKKAVDLVYKLSRGTPRVINAICDRALLIGYTKEVKVITPKIVKQASLEIHGPKRAKAKPKTRKIDVTRALPTSFAVTVVAVLLLLFAVLSGPLPGPSEIGAFFSAQFTDRGRVEADGIATVTPVEEIPTIAPEVVASQPEPTPPEPKIQVAAAVLKVKNEPEVKLPDPTPIATLVQEPKKREVSAPVVKSKPDSDTKDPPVEEVVREEKSIEIASVRQAEPKAVVEWAAPPVPVKKAASKKPTPEKSTPKKPARAATLIAQDRAVTALLEAWSMAVLSERPRGASVEGLRRFGWSNGLSSAHLKPTLRQLVTINLPALVRLDSESGGYWSALLSARDDAVEITDLKGVKVSRNFADAARLFTGEAVVFWEDPAPTSETLRATSEGDPVRALQDRLRALGLYAGDSTGRYDARTIDVVTQVQRATGLVPDGIAGPYTRMVITAWFREASMPTLTGESFPSSARERVLNSPGMILSSVPLGPGEAGLAPADSEPLPEIDLSTLATSESREPEIESIVDEAPVEEIVRTAPGFRDAGRDSQPVKPARQDFAGDELNPTVSSENIGVPKYRSILVPDVKTGEVTDPSRATFRLVPRMEDAADVDGPR